MLCHCSNHISVDEYKFVTLFDRYYIKDYIKEILVNFMFIQRLQLH